MFVISIIATSELGHFGREGLNPVRAGMVRQPSDYSWSSYQINALGKESNLCTAHPLYLALARDSIDRQKNYRELFKYQIEGQLLEDIRSATNRGMVLGNERLTTAGRRMTAQKNGVAYWFWFTKKVKK